MNILQKLFARFRVRHAQGDQGDAEHETLSRLGYHSEHGHVEQKGHAMVWVKDQDEQMILQDFPKKELDSPT